MAWCSIKHKENFTFTLRDAEKYLFMYDLFNDALSNSLYSAIINVLGIFETVKLLIIRFSVPSCYFPSVRPKYSLHHPDCKYNLA
jgi:hypothetical protein